MLKDKLKSIVKQEGKDDSKKKIENLVVFVIILIITIIIINNVWNKDTGGNENANNSIDNKKLATQTVNEDSNTLEKTDDLEEKLGAILNTINGVGKVKVFINYSESSTVEAMYNENTKESSTEETDTSGGVRTIQETDTQKDIIYSEKDGNKTPVTQKVTKPTIEGAIITAKGARDTTVKANIVEAVSAVTGLATHKIQVFEMSEFEK